MKFKIYLPLLLGLQLFFLVNLQFTAWPEMLSYSYLRNNGFLIYKDMIHPYPPILTMGLSVLYKFLGYHIWVLQSVAWGLALLSSIGVWFIARYLTKNETIALFVLFVYVLLQPFLDGNMLWFDTVIVLPILFGLYFLIKNNLLLAGLFLSLATLTKQTVGLYLLFVIFYLLFSKKATFNQLKNIFIGPLILGVPLLVRLIQEGALTDFINWTLIYPITQFRNFPGYVHTELSVEQLLVSIFLLAPLLFLTLKNRDFLRDKFFQLLLMFLFISIFIIYPRFSFFHAQTALAILLIAYGYLLSKTKTNFLLATFYLLLVIFFVQQPVFALNWQKETRFYGKSDLELAKIIEDKTKKESRVYLLGLHSGLYSMSDRIPPKRWADNFGWYLEIPGVSEEVMSRWKKNLPEFIFWRTPNGGNWSDLGTYQPKKIVSFLSENYTKKEEVKPGIWLWEKKTALND